jgi:uncharacterized protein (DUF1800 family)
MRKVLTVAALVLCPLLFIGARSPKLSKDEQVIHALNRLTFGPRPGDVEAVRKMGLKKWIDLQLHPERIAENPELAQKLAPLESLRLSQTETERTYPNPQMIRAIAAGRQPMPDDPVTRAAVERVIRRVRAAKNGAGADNGPLEPAVALDQLLTREQIRTLRTGTVEQKRAVIASVPEDQMDDVAIALPTGLRLQLLPAVEPALRRKLMLLTAPQQLVAFDLSEGKLYRAILSNRQLEEQMVDFWYNHFNVFLDKGADRYLVPTYEREVIRPHVLGRFRNLLEATAKSPAMLFYLDNWESVGAAPPQRRGNTKRPVRGLNENYARELMELHTLGVDGGYTQEDVTEVARCFTGWTIRLPRQGGDFFYNDRVHDKGEKTVLGVKIPAGGGQDDAEKVLDILSRHPSTARFISKKLAQRFVADDPPQKLIDKMARTFRDKNGDIREVMKTMLASDEFFSQTAYRAKVKTPFEMIVSAVRATGAQVDFAFPLARQIADLGEPLYRKLEPTGYSDANSEWVNSAALLARMNFALSLAQNKVPGSKLDASLFNGNPDEVARQVLFTDARPETLAAIDKQVQSAKAPVVGLLLGSPDFQRR